ncbi:three-helix bundle dimerization domain-containing protein [Nocardia sp. NPDC050630]|uniref:three-helix bundle dimerization domain-containing protein n=1 Tax=Nocardia sp. NPDC050630 TaxID=3364321 RepID=UPI0037AF8C2B
MTEGPVTHPPLHQPSLDQQFALKAAARRLEREFESTRDEAIEGWLYSAYDYLADHATIDNFLPLLAERYTRELLRASAEQNAD